MPVVCITGASGGLGKAFTYECARRGYDLFLTGTKEPSLQKLAQEIAHDYDVKVSTHVCDLTNIEERDSLKRAISEQYGKLNMLINVAGLGHESLFESLTTEEIIKIIRLNVEGTVATTHLLLPLHCEAETFRLINVGSLAAFQPMPYKSVYAASKRFLLDWSYALCEELKDFATVTILCPAGLPTKPEIIESIKSQGLLGSLTTKSVQEVARKTIDAAIKGKRLVIPGTLNRLAARASGILPRVWAAKLVNWRWSKTHAVLKDNLTRKQDEK